MKIVFGQMSEVRVYSRGFDTVRGMGIGRVSGYRGDGGAARS